MMMGVMLCTHCFFSLNVETLRKQRKLNLTPEKGSNLEKYEWDKHKYDRPRDFSRFNDFQRPYKRLMQHFYFVSPFRGPVFKQIMQDKPIERKWSNSRFPPLKKWKWQEVCYLLPACVCACLIAQSCRTICDPMNSGPPDSSVHGILQARILEWVAIPLSRELPQPRDQTWVSCIAGGFFTVGATRVPMYIIYC